MQVSLNLRIISLSALAFISIVDAQKVGVKSELGFGCFNCALKWNFGCPDVALPYDCRCTKDDFLTTAMGCVADHAKDIPQLLGGWNYIRDQCHYWGNRTMDISEMSDIYAKSKGRLIDATSFNTTVAPGPIDVPDSLLASQLVSTRDTKRHYNVGNNFGWSIIGYWALIMIGGIVTNAIRVMCPDIYNVFGAGRVTNLRKLLTLPALNGKNHHSPWKLRKNKYISFYMPTRGQFIIIAVFLLINLVSIVAFNNVNGETPFSFTNESDRKLHYLANRTGIIAVAHIPLIVLFACRNNPLIILTGWPYDTFMTYHRWCARMMGTHAIIHGVSMYWSSAKENVVSFKWLRVHNWRGGNLAVYMVVIMLIMALRKVRSRIYETFKFTHVFMFVIFIICMLVHCSDYGWLGWLISSLAFYAIEYIGRITRIIMSGGILKARFTYTDANLYRIKVPGNHRKWDLKPGSFVYIRILDKNMFWQSHPFSIFQSNASEKDNSIDLCCKAQLGATRVMLQKLIATPEKTFTKKVLIDGPYGNENYVCDYESILLFAGGVGFTAMYAFASHIIKRIKPGQYLCLIWIVKDCKTLSAFEPEIAFLVRNCKNSCNFRIFVTRPEETDLGTVKLQESEMVNENLAMDRFPETPRLFSSSTLVNNKSHIDVGDIPLEDHVRTDSEAPELRNADSMDDDSVRFNPDACQILIDGDVLLNIDYFRPNVSAEVCDFIRAANGSKAICSCGPPMFVDAIRNGILESIMESDSRVDYFEDAFSWKVEDGY